MNSKSKAARLATAPNPALWSVGIAAQLQKPNRIAQESSLRVPATTANREYLRALRQAEMAAWRGPSSAQADAALSAEVQKALRHHQTESRVLAGVFAAALLAVAAGLIASLHFAQHWTEVANLLRQWLG